MYLKSKESRAKVYYLGIGLVDYSEN
jgi:hypothetical protein